MWAGTRLSWIWSAGTGSVFREKSFLPPDPGSRVLGVQRNPLDLPAILIQSKEANVQHCTTRRLRRSADHAVRDPLDVPGDGTDDPAATPQEDPRHPAVCRVGVLARPGSAGPLQFRPVLRSYAGFGCRYVECARAADAAEAGVHRLRPSREIDRMKIYTCDVCNKEVSESRLFIVRTSRPGRLPSEDLLYRELHLCLKDWQGFGSWLQSQRSHFDQRPSTREKEAAQ